MLGLPIEYLKETMNQLNDISYSIFKKKKKTSLNSTIYNLHHPSLYDPYTSNYTPRHLSQNESRKSNKGINKDKTILR